MKTLFMGSTEIPVNRTISEIIGKLTALGARSIHTQLADNRSGRITSMSFSIINDRGDRFYHYSLPVRTDAVLNKIRAGRKRGHVQGGKDSLTRDREQADRVAWRQLLRWIEAQLAMVDIGMAETKEVFLPYELDQQGKSFFERYLENEKRMLEASK